MKTLICLYFFSSSHFAGVPRELPEYRSFSHYDVARYPFQYKRGFDKEGIIIQNNEYHALTISIYGIMNYDAFIRTGDSVYYLRVLNQFRYFRDSTKLIYSDNNKSAGLPYNFDFVGMKAPWFSGMTQGVAVSFLLRYYDLTSDKYALELSRKLVHMMLKDEKDGGTIGRTKEGGMWIEEYPNNDWSKSVLNGFVNGLVGLHEYCRAFPDDTHAGEIRDSCYTEMIENLVQYDSSCWTYYNRNSAPITNSYLLYQLHEFDHLYSLYKDPRLRDQMRIWSKFGLNKFDTEIQFLKNPKYQFAVRLSGNPAVDTSVFNDYGSFSKGLVEEFPAYTSNNVNRYNFSDDRYYCELKSTEIRASEIRITGKYQDKAVELTINDSVNRLIIQSDEPFNALWVEFPETKSENPPSVSLLAYDYRMWASPLFAFCEIERKEVLLKNKNYRFTYDASHLTNAKVFYRYAQNETDADSAKYNIQQVVELQGGYFYPRESGVYQFFISYDIMHPYSSLSGFKVNQGRFVLETFRCAL